MFRKCGFEKNKKVPLAKLCLKYFRILIVSFNTLLFWPFPAWFSTILFVIRTANVHFLHVLLKSTHLSIFILTTSRYFRTPFKKFLGRSKISNFYQIWINKRVSWMFRKLFAQNVFLFAENGNVLLWTL